MLRYLDHVGGRVETVLLDDPGVALLKPILKKRLARGKRC